MLVLKKDESDKVWSEISQFKTIRELLTWMGVKKAIHKYIENYFEFLKQEINENIDTMKLYFGDADIQNDQELFYHIYYFSRSETTIEKRLKSFEFNLIMNKMYHFYRGKDTETYANLMSGEHEKEYQKFIRDNKLECFVHISQAMYSIRQDIQASDELNEPILMSGGFPELRVGNMCRGYIPVFKLSSQTFKVKDTIVLFNPRNKKKTEYKVLNVKCSDGSYYYKLEGDIFISDYVKIAKAYDSLFPFNKALFSGWQNRKLYLHIK